MVDHLWEKERIRLIRNHADNYLKKRGFGISNIVENTRDGGYVSYENKIGTKIIRITFLPNYDVLFIKKENILSFIVKSIFKQHLVTKELSIKSELSFGFINDENFVFFLKKALAYIDTHNLI